MCKSVWCKNLKTIWSDDDTNKTTNRNQVANLLQLTYLQKQRIENQLLKKSKLDLQKVKKAFSRF